MVICSYYAYVFVEKENVISGKKNDLYLLWNRVICQKTEAWDTSFYIETTNLGTATDTSLVAQLVRQWWGV